MAIKVILPIYTNDNELAFKVLEEASLLAQLNHPNILRVFDFEIGAGLSYIVTEYAPGGSLADRIHPKPGEPTLRTPLEQVGKYLTQIASALDFAHKNYLVHRDIKAQNILLDANDRPY